MQKEIKIDNINELMSNIAKEQESIYKRVERVINLAEKRADQYVTDSRAEVLKLKSQVMEQQMEVSELKERLNKYETANVEDFKTWLLSEGYEFYDDETPEHDLYLDIKSDKEFPVATNFDDIYFYLKRCRACREALETFVIVYEDYYYYKIKNKICGSRY